MIPTLYEIDPLHDSRWNEFVMRSADSSIFHAPAWLLALQRAYGYTPVAFTTTAAGAPLQDALLFCRVSSWMTGKRLVSIPFSDHCEPLMESPERLRELLAALKGRLAAEGRYIEIRPLRAEAIPSEFERSESFCFHTIDLRPELPEIFSRFHKNHVQRTIRKAERSGLTVEIGRERSLLDAFYAMHRLTRHRHSTPVQPLSWFEHLLETHGDRARIYLARYEGNPAAAIFNITHKTMLVYKYGCSDATYNRFGATSLLFWRAMQDGKALGLTEFDLGRSDTDNEGLVAFKDHLGGQRSTIHYYRCTRERGGHTSSKRAIKVAQRVYEMVPSSVRVRMGTELYRHFA